MSWLRVLTALGILAVAAGALLVFARCTSPAARGEHGPRRGRDRPTDRDTAPGLRTDAEGSGLFPRTGGED
ncbi:hypothetical protein ACPC54_24340 [Kitasatospora sp. NPDC094028]